LNVISNNVHPKPYSEYRTAQLELEVGNPAFYLGGPCFKHVSADLV
jgi:hypothetical protein